MTANKAEMKSLEERSKELFQNSVKTDQELEQVETLLWNSTARTSIAFTSPLLKLKEMNLTNNKLTSLDFLANTPALERLYLADNAVETISEQIKNVTHLHTFDISFNKIKDINSLKILETLSKLRFLCVRGNPFVPRFAKFGEIILKMLPELENLNDKGVQVLKHNIQQQANPVTLDGPYLSKLDPFENLQNLKLVDCKISSIQIIQKNNNVKHLDLSDNLLTKLDGVQFFANLTELVVEKNLLVDISDVGHLTALRKLEVGSNQIASLGVCLTGLKDLSLLSLENNKIKSLSSITELNNLLELYIGENLIDDLKEIKHIAGLKKLIVLELWGNPLCKEYDYKLYTIFHIKDIKVLDGNSILQSEFEEAKEAFTGRLSDELLNTKLVGKNLNTLEFMDLSRCNLRDFDNIFSHTRFPALTEINVSSNFFTSLKCFGHLPLLKILIIADNRLSSFDPIADPKMKIGLNGMPVSSPVTPDARDAGHQPQQVHGTRRTEVLQPPKTLRPQSGQQLHPQDLGHQSPHKSAGFGPKR
jgi:Leucine-rich repeat (LRR) protein